MESAFSPTPRITPRQAAALAEGRPETATVSWLLRTRQLPDGAFRNAFSPETGEANEVVDWVFFSRFTEADYDAVEAAGIPVVRSCDGTWIGSDRLVPYVENGFLAAVAEALDERDLRT